MPRSVSYATWPWLMQDKRYAAAFGARAREGDMTLTKSATTGTAVGPSMVFLGFCCLALRKVADVKYLLVVLWAANAPALWLAKFFADRFVPHDERGFVLLPLFALTAGPLLAAAQWSLIGLGVGALCRSGQPQRELNPECARIRPPLDARAKVRCGLGALVVATMGCLAVGCLLGPALPICCKDPDSLVFIAGFAFIVAWCLSHFGIAHVVRRRAAKGSKTAA